MEITHVLPRIITEASGPTYSVPSLCKSLSKLNNNVSLHILNPSILDNEEMFDLCLYRTLPFIKNFGISPDMKHGLYTAARDAEIIHNHSMWMMPNIYSYQAAAHAGCKFIFSPRGTLSEWAMKRSKFRKSIVWWMGQRKSLFGADCIHATSEQEVKDIRRTGLTSPVALIPNGVDVPLHSICRDSQSKKFKLLYLSRIHPTKGIDNLLHAWLQLEVLFPNWSLEIAGPLDGSYPKEMVSLSAKLGLQRVRFVGELLGQDKESAFSNADLFVLPTHSENFGLVVAEALSHGTPVVTTKGAPWAGLERHECGWWIDIGLSPLSDALAKAMQLPSEKLVAMGASGQTWMQNEYSWQSIGERMLITYKWILGKETKPQWIME